MKIKIFKCEGFTTKDNTKMYKINGFLNGEGCQNEFIEIFTTEPKEVDFEYTCNFRVKDNKYLKLVIKDLIKDTNKGIFNK